MKRKTAIKKLMGTGLSRNEAAYLLFLCQGCGWNNRDIASFVRMLRMLPPSGVWDEMFE